MVKSRKIRKATSLIYKTNYGFKYYFKELSKPILLFILVYLTGIIIYMFIENLSFIDAFYFVTVTALTIGYGDIHPKTEIGKLFTSFYAWFAVSTGFYLLFKVAELRAMLIDKRLFGKFQDD